MGCGSDVIYPAEHRKLAAAIVENGGTLITELPVGTQPLAENFATRNRVLSGLSLSVVIIEAAEKSGLISARMALEQDRQVFAMPGSALGGKARGSSRLLKEGANLVESVEDVIEELASQLALTAGNQAASRNVNIVEGGGPKPETSAVASLDQGIANEAKAILSNLQHQEKFHIDSIIEASGLKAQTVLRLLLELELRGIVAQHPGKLFSLA
jgi:DNA processing protein